MSEFTSTTPAYHTTRENPSFSLQSSTGTYTTTPSMHHTTSRTVNITSISNNTKVTPRDIFSDISWTGTTIPSNLFNDDVINPTETIYFDEVTMSSGTIPFLDSPIPSVTTTYDDITGSGSGDVAIHSGDDITIPSITLPYSDDAIVSSGTVMFDGNDDVTVFVPTVFSDNWSDLTTSTWLDLPEYIPLSVTVPMETHTPPPELTPTTASPTTITMTTAERSPAQSTGEESNAIHLPDGLGGGDSYLSQTNQIARRRVFLRERTRNKRIEELLEEKRNFLLRMKRGHSA